MKPFYITIMSIDPSDNSEDNHQKYGLTIEAKNSADAEKEGMAEFKREYGNLPIFWVKSFEI
jgi:hypothetical protein